MGDPVIRPRNVAVMIKVETTEGVDAAPVAADMVPVEIDGLSWNHPFTSEASNESTGDLVQASALIRGQPADIRIPFRLKGNTAGYSGSVKPPHHPLFAICGLRGQYTGNVASAALVAGTATSATLGAAFSAVADAYVGQPLNVSIGAQGVSIIHAYSSGKVADLVDSFSPDLSSGVNGQLLPNWTYMGTSPRSSAERLTDHPSGTIYIYEDGLVLKFLGCRGVIEQLTGQPGRPGFGTSRVSGIFAGSFRTDAAIPTGLPSFAWGAPQIQKGPTGVQNAVSVNYKPLPISQFTLRIGGELESPDDPNTPYGFGSAHIGGRGPQLELDPLMTLVATRDALANISAKVNLVGGIRSSATTVGNRWALTFPALQPIDAQPQKRGMFRSERQVFQCVSRGRDPQTRNMDFALCMY